jgi:hypothetical protein
VDSGNAADLPFIGDQVVCLSHEQAARSGPAERGAQPGAVRKFEDYYVFPMGSGFCAVGQSRTPTAMVAAN